jgi:hypothetical protein
MLQIKDVCRESRRISSSQNVLLYYRPIYACIPLGLIPSSFMTNLCTVCILISPIRALCTSHPTPLGLLVLLITYLVRSIYEL